MPDPNTRRLLQVRELSKGSQKKRGAVSTHFETLFHFVSLFPASLINLAP